MGSWNGEAVNTSTNYFHEICLRFELALSGKKKIPLCSAFAPPCRKDRIRLSASWIVFVPRKSKEDSIVFRNRDIISDIRGQADSLLKGLLQYKDNSFYTRLDSVQFIETTIWKQQQQQWEKSIQP